MPCRERKSFFLGDFLLCPYSSASIWLQPGYRQVFQTTISNSLSPATLWLPWPAAIMGLQGKAIVGTRGLSALWRTGLSLGCHSSHQAEPRESTICCEPIAARWHSAGWERAPAWQGTATHHITGKKGQGGERERGREREKKKRKKKELLAIQKMPCNLGVSTKMLGQMFWLNVSRNCMLESHASHFTDRPN